MARKDFLRRVMQVLPAVVLLCAGCGKDESPANRIQEGATTIEINAIYPGHLQVRYGAVIEAPIDLTIVFHLVDGGDRQARFRIPAGYKSLQGWTGDGYLNIWDYLGGSDSLAGSQGSIDPGWDIGSVDIVSVSCPDSQYGFKVLTGADQWSSFYHPTDSVTTVRFVVNKDTVKYSDYDFNLADAIVFRQSTSFYNMIPFHYSVQLFCGPASYPLQQGMTMEVPFFLYLQGNRQWGSALDGAGSDTNGSTLTLTVTKLTDTHFNAVFSGKIWSGRQPDTLFISDGTFTNAPLPVVR